MRHNNASYLVEEASLPAVCAVGRGGAISERYVDCADGVSRKVVRFGARLEVLRRKNGVLLRALRGKEAVAAVEQWF